MISGRSQPPSRQIMIYGKPAQAALEESLADFWVGQSVLATNSSLAGPQGLADQVAEGLGKTCKNRITGLRENTPRSDVVRLAAALRSRGTEAVVAIGGGSVIEAAKAARICLTNNVRNVDDMDRLRSSTTAASPRPYLFSIPTTLSGAEFTQFAGVTDERSGVKDAFFHTDLAPDVVILDPAMTVATPQNLWLSTGLRAVDHAIESWCAPNAVPYGDATALYGLRLLAQALPRTHDDPADLEARLDCQIGAWMAIQAATVGVTHGASHGIGHALSAVTGMTHGVTSCIMLPHVLRYNAGQNAERQAPLAEAMGAPGRPLADTVADLVARLGMPTRLRDAGVAEEQIEAIAAAALDNFRVKANPRPFDSGAMLSVLRAAF